MLKDKLAAKDNFSFSAGIPGLGNVGFSTADQKAKDNFSFNAGVKGLGNVGFSTADNSLTCDSQGNCMLKDRLDLCKGVALRLDDNSLTCDSAGNCMLKDKLAKDNFKFSAGVKGLGNVGFQTADAKDNFSIGGSFGGFSAGMKFADNSLTCDSAGNCMLKDNLFNRAVVTNQGIHIDDGSSTVIAF